MPAPFCVCGILNITPDSFSDGRGVLPDTAEILSAARRMCDGFEACGCGMLDLGAESTRPGAVPVDTVMECARLLPVLAAVRSALPGVFVSVDTVKASTAERALALGADAINDVSGCADPAMADLLADYASGYVLTCPEPYDGMAGMCEWFRSRLNFLISRGLPEDHIVIDPGIGFGKSAGQSAALLRDIAGLTRLGRPVYLGVSRKSFLNAMFGVSSGERDSATGMVTMWAACQGVVFHRVHDVGMAITALHLAAALKNKE